MAEFKIVIGDKKGKCVQKEMKDADAAHFLGLKIGDKVNGELLGLTGYEFEITGGSDSAGFPMRKDVAGSARKKILAISGVGIINKKKYRDVKKKGMRVMEGMRQRKTVAGNTIHEKTAQINLKVLVAGKQPLVEAAAPTEKPEGEAPAEKPAEAQTTEAKPKAEEKKEEPKPEAKPKEEPKVEKKEEVKPEAKEEVKEVSKEEAPKKEEPKPEEKKEEKEE